MALAEPDNKNIPLNGKSKDSYNKKYNNLNYQYNNILKNDNNYNLKIGKNESQIGQEVESIETITNKKREELFNKYKATDNLDFNNQNSLIYSRNNNNISSNNIIQDYNNINNSNNNYFYNNNTLLDIEKLKQEISELEKLNIQLMDQLNEEQTKNNNLQNLEKDQNNEGTNNALEEIRKMLQVNTVDDIVPKLQEMQNYICRTKTNDSKKKSEFIFRIKELYLNLTESHENIEDIPITILWRWIKHLIHTVKQLAIEKENNIMHQNNEENYKEYCMDLIHEFGLNDLDELKKFIDDLLLRNNLNIKKMQQLKNFLLNNKNYNSNA